MVSVAHNQPEGLGNDIASQVALTPNNTHILFVNSSMVCGGAERVIVLLSGYWVRAGTRTSVVTIHSPDHDHHQLDERVGRVSLGANKSASNVFEGLRNNVGRISKLRRAIRKLKPSVIVSFQDTNNVLTLISAVGLAIPVIVCERNDPRMRPFSAVRSILRRLLYRSASALVVQTQALVAWGQTIVGPEKVHVIPNPVGRPVLSGTTPANRQESIIAVGRLVKQKGFDILLQAISLCEHRWVLHVLGEGPERPALELLAKELGISDRVQFVGQVDDPSVHFRRASLFVLSSRYEGFPNVLLEAMACGLPVVSFDCQSGPAEIIRPGIDGVLIPPGDSAAFANAIDTLMLNPKQRAEFAERAPDVVERFAEDKIVSEWEALIGRVSSPKDL